MTSPSAGTSICGQQLVDQVLLALAQLVPARPAVEAVEGGRIAGLVRSHAGRLGLQSSGSASAGEAVRQMNKSVLSTRRSSLRDCRTCSRRPAVSHAGRRARVRIAVSPGHRPHRRLVSCRSARLRDNGRSVPVSVAAVAGSSLPSCAWTWPTRTRLRRRGAPARRRRTAASTTARLWRGGQRRWVPLPRSLSRDRRLQVVDQVGLFPREEVAVGLAAEMAVGGGRLVDRLVERQMRADAARASGRRASRSCRSPAPVRRRRPCRCRACRRRATAALDTPIA